MWVGFLWFWPKRNVMYLMWVVDLSYKVCRLSSILCWVEALQLFGIPSCGVVPGSIGPIYLLQMWIFVLIGIHIFLILYFVMWKHKQIQHAHKLHQYTENNTSTIRFRRKLDETSLKTSFTSTSENN